MTILEATTQALATGHRPLCPEDYPGLRFDEGALERLAEVNEFLASAPFEHQDLLRADIHRNLAYLSDFGGPTVRVHLYRDFAPLSFGLLWYRGATLWFNGGLIWHGGSNDPLTITLTPCLWSVHT